MGLSVNGENNRLTIVVEGRERELTEEVPGLDIAVEGNDNRVRIEYPQTFENSRLKITGNGNCFEAAASYRRTDGVFFCLGDGCRISIGRNCFFNRDIAVLAKEKKAVSVVVGDDVIVGTGTIIRCGDGHTVVDAGSGQVYGTLQDVTETGANDVYVVETEEGKEVLLPAIPSCILKVSVEEARMTVHILEGLLE